MFTPAGRFRCTGTEVVEVAEGTFYDIRYKRLLDKNNCVRTGALLAAGSTFATMHGQWRKGAIRIVGNEEMKQPARQSELKAPAPDDAVTTMVDEEPATHIDLDEEAAPEAPDKPKKPAKKTGKKRTAKKKKTKKTKK